MKTKICCIYVYLFQVSVPVRGRDFRNESQKLLPQQIEDKFVLLSCWIISSIKYQIQIHLEAFHSKR